MLKYVLYCLLFIGLGILAKVAWKWINVLRSDDYHQMLHHLYDHSIQTIAIDDVKALASYTLLDCREKNEFDVSHIPSAQWVGYSQFDIEGLDKINKEDTIVVYCSVGYRSEKIGEKLISNGFRNVYNLYGGIFEWVNTNNDVEVPAGKSQQIHSYSASWKKWITKKINIIHD